MKTLLAIFLLLLELPALCQESFRKSFKLEDSIILKGGSVIKLKKEQEVPFNSLTQPEKDSIRRIFSPNRVLNYTIERNIPAGKVSASEQVLMDDAFFNNLKVKKIVTVETLPAKEGFVKFDEDKIWVNPNLSGEYENPGLHFYQLGNRQSVDLHFTEVTVSALTIPIKYRFRKKAENSSSKDISEEFTTAVNVNLFVGKTVFGKTKFHYREKVGNITNTTKITLGLLGGASTVTLDKSNTTASKDPIADDSKIVKGLASLGFGGTYTFNKINFGLFYGFDFSVGDNSSRWNYNKKPWIGLAIGYSLLPF